MAVVILILLTSCIVIVKKEERFIIQDMWQDNQQLTPKQREYELEDRSPISRISFEHFKELVQTVMLFDDEDISKLAIPVSGSSLLMDNPQRFRWKFIRIRGIISQLTVIKLKEKIGKVTNMSMAILKTLNGDSFALIVIQNPSMLYLKEDTVEVEGYFIKIASLKTRAGERVFMPLLITKRLKRYV